MADSRAALRELLCKSRLATCRCVRMAIDGLLHNLQRFPTDRESIWLYVFSKSCRSVDIICILQMFETTRRASC